MRVHCGVIDEITSEDYCEKKVYLLSVRNNRRSRSFMNKTQTTDGLNMMVRGFSCEQLGRAQPTIS